MDTLTSRFTNCFCNEGIGFYYTYNGKGKLVRIEMKSFILAQKRSTQRDVALPRELSVRQLRSCLPKETYSTRPQVFPAALYYRFDLMQTISLRRKLRGFRFFANEPLDKVKQISKMVKSIKEVNYILPKSAEYAAIYFKTILLYMTISAIFASITPFLPRKLHFAPKP